MQKTLCFLAVLFLAQLILPGATCLAQARRGKAPYPAMAPLDRYFVPDQNSEIALARTAAPASISDAAEVMVLGRDGFASAVKGTNGFVQATAAAFDNKKLPALEPGAMCYMLSKQQYLSDEGTSWHPHVMFFVAGSAAKSWGADLPGSPVIASDDPEERFTIFMVLVGKWSDGTPAPQAMH
jgi:hypothetical protein